MPTPLPDESTMTLPRRIKATAATCLHRSGLLSLRRALFEKGRAVLLMYHRVNDHRDPFFPSLERRVFADQLDFLERHYHVDSLDNVMEWVASGARGPSRVAITIDDGYPDTYDVVREELSRRDLTATVFLSTLPIETGTPLWTDRLRHALKHTKRDELPIAAIGLDPPPGGGELSLSGTASRLAALRWLLDELKDRTPQVIEDAVERLLDELATEGPPLSSLSWDQVREMASTCFSIGAHTHRHYMLSRLEDSEVESEIRTSVELLEQRTGRPVSLFCYPNGRRRDYDARSQAVLRALGIRYAVCAEGGFVSPGYDPFALPRLYTSETHLALFATRLAGLGSATDGAAESEPPAPLSAADAPLEPVASIDWNDAPPRARGLGRR